MGMLDEIKQAKLSYDLELTVQRLTGQQITMHKVCCPTGGDTTPSLHLYPDGHFHCFHCNQHGDVVDFAGLVLHGAQYDPDKHLREAIDFLAGHAPAPTPRRMGSPPPASPPPGLDPELALRAHREMPLAARKWWRSRGLVDEAIDLFLLGYDGRYTIPNFYKGVLVGLHRRRDDWAEPGDAPKYLQAKGSRVMLFNSSVLDHQPSLVLITEGEIDCMLLTQWGFPAVSGTGGAGTWKAEWAAALARVPEIGVLMDADAAGRRGEHLILSCIRRAKAVSLPPGIKDVGQLWDKYQSDAEGVVDICLGKVAW